MNVEEEVEEEGEKESEFGVARSSSGDGSKTEYYVFVVDLPSSNNTPPPT